MSLLKPMVWLFVLGAIGYYAYVSFNKTPATDPPNIGSDWEKPPQIQLGPSATSNGQSAGNLPPSYTPISTLPPPAGNSLAPPPARLSNPPPVAPPISGFAPPTTPNGVGNDPGTKPPGPATLIATDQPAGGNFGTTSVAPAGPPGTLRDTMELARPLLAERKMAEVLRLLTPWYNDPRLAPSEEAALNDLLDELAGAVVYSRQHLLVGAYIVRAGDRLEDIAVQYKVPWQLLANVNGIPIANPALPPPGSELKVVNGPFSGTVDGQRHTLTLFVQDCYAGRFSVGLGQQSRFDFSAFIVCGKAPSSNPDPAQSVLSRCWVDLEPLARDGVHQTLHCSSEADRPNRDGSPGCFSLSPHDAEDVYGILSVGSRITLRR